MITIEQVNGEIAVLEQETPTHVLMQKLAALYVVRDHLAIGRTAAAVQAVSESEFSQAMAGKDTEFVLSIVDELMNTLKIIQPRLYASVIRKLND